MSPKHRIWLKIQNAITIFRGYLFGFANSCQLTLLFYFILHAVLLSQC